jgi:outer membrane autotransporter protein
VVTVVPSSSTAIYDGADNAASIIQLNNSVTLNSETLPSPLNKQDVIGSIEATTNIATRSIESVFTTIDDRLSWLSRHKDATQNSYQGIKIHFKDKVIDAIMNITPRSKVSIVDNIKNTDITNKVIALLENSEKSQVAITNSIKSDAQDIAINEAARIRKGLIGSLNPTFGTVVDDWSMWTSGQITIGKTDATSVSSKQQLDGKSLSLGFDKPMDNDGLIGYALSVGSDEVEVGESTSKVSSDNYSLSAYRVFTQNNKVTIETIVGLGHLKIDTTRVDDSETLIGQRNAEQIFGSLTLRDKIISHDNWAFSPYGKLTLARTKLKKFSEVGGITALTFDEQIVNDVKIYVGSDMNYLIAINNGTIMPYAKFEYIRDVSSNSDATMHYNSEIINYTLELDKKSKNSLKIGLGVDLLTKDNLNASIGYTREQSSDNDMHNDSLKFNVELRF